MASHLVAQHQLISYATPINGAAGDATVVLGNDNTTVAGYDAHDSDATIHVQDSSAAVFAATPAATAGRKWMVTDTGVVALHYDTGSAWVEVNYLKNGAGGTTAQAIGGTALTSRQLLLTGSFTGTGVGAVGLEILSTLVAGAANTSSVGLRVLPTLTRFGSGTHPDFLGCQFVTPTINGSATTITNAATVKIEGAPTAGSNNYALWVNNGGSGSALVFLDTTLTVTGLTSLSPSAANQGLIASTGYSLTGSDQTGMVSLAGTWNTSGAPSALKIAVTNTASNAASKVLQLLGGAAGATALFSVGITGNVGIGASGGTSLNGSTASIIQMGTRTIIENVVEVQSAFMNNAYYDGSNWKYVVTAVSSGIRLQSGAVTMHTVASGTAGDTIAAMDTTAVGLTLTNLGSLVLGNAAIATNATDGFLYVVTCAGTPNGTPTAQTGRAAMIYDTTGNKIWFYNGSWRGVAVT